MRHCMPWKLMGNPVAMGTKNKNIATAHTLNPTTTHGPHRPLLHTTTSQ